MKNKIKFIQKDEDKRLDKNLFYYQILYKERKNKEYKKGEGTNGLPFSTYHNVDISNLSRQWNEHKAHRMYILEYIEMDK